MKGFALMVNTEEISKVGLCHVQFLLYWLWPDVEQDIENFVG